MLCISQVIGHTHSIPDADRAMSKRVVPQSLHMYDWDLAHKANKDKPYFACTGYDCAQLKVLAFSPAMVQLLTDSASWLEFSMLLQGLAQLGQLLGRAIAWPSLPCKTSWISKGAVLKYALSADTAIQCRALYCCQHEVDVHSHVQNQCLQ